MVVTDAVAQISVNVNFNVLVGGVLARTKAPANDVWLYSPYCAVRVNASLHFVTFVCPCRCFITNLALLFSLNALSVA